MQAGWVRCTDVFLTEPDRADSQQEVSRAQKPQWRDTEDLHEEDERQPVCEEQKLEAVSELCVVICG